MLGILLPGLRGYSTRLQNLALGDHFNYDFLCILHLKPKKIAAARPLPLEPPAGLSRPKSPPGAYKFLSFFFFCDIFFFCDTYPPPQGGGREGTTGSAQYMVVIISLNVPFANESAKKFGRNIFDLK